MIENLIGRVLTEEITIGLAQYDGENAVFYQQAANDKDKKWDGKQYPRVDYNIDWSFNAERRTAGTMAVNVWCTNETTVLPEDIGIEVKSILSDLFLTDESGTYSLLWLRTDAFDTSGHEPQMTGVTVSFDVVAYPIQLSTTPDPVLSLMDYIKEHWPPIKVIGIDEIPVKWRPSDAEPAAYIRLGGDTSNMKPSNAVGWLVATLIGHIIAPTVTVRQQWLKRITDNLAVYAEMPMDDGSPMFIEGLSFNTASNPLTVGQLTIKGKYGVLRQYPDAEALNYAHLNYEGEV